MSLSDFFVHKHIFYYNLFQCYQSIIKFEHLWRPSWIWIFSETVHFFIFLQEQILFAIM